MKTECPCGARNRPWVVTCVTCHRKLQTPEVAAARKREWDAFSPDVRESMEAGFAKTASKAEEVRAFRQRRLVIFAISGAIAYPLLLEFLPPRLSGVWVMLAAPFGAGAAMAYHKYGPGAFRGALIFAGTYLVVTFVKVSLCEMAEEFWMGLWLHSAIATFLIAMVGWCIGFTDSEER